jgi:phytoene dehydrogenase-like protein
VPPAAGDADVLVVGAGLAGLTTALHCADAGLVPLVLEASDEVGGRVRTDVVDGMLLDRGFQVYDTAYPEARRMLDHTALDLRPFTPGALIAVDDRRHRVGDPRRRPQDAVSTLRAPIGSLRDKVRIGLLVAGVATLPPGRLLERPDVSTLDALRAAGVSDTAIDRFFRPFLSGVLLETELSTARRFTDLLLRGFARGDQAVPAAGMGAIPHHLAERLSPGTVRCDTPVREVAPGRVTLEDGSTLTAGAVVVATDPPSASELVAALKPVTMNSVVTHYHLAPEPPTPDSVIVLDGQARGPVANSVLLTAAAPSYAPGRHLVSSSVVRGDAGELAVRRHLALLHGTDTARWEHVATYDVRVGTPAQPAPAGRLRRPVRLEEGLYVASDARDTGSIQGAMVSGRRAARAVVADLTPAAVPVPETPEERPA